MRTTAPAGNDGKARVLGAVNLVELIGKSVSLKRRGKNYLGLCPFHSEKTPSFTVDPSKQYFRCFGCKESGNAIDFVMKRDRVSFVEALTQLADEFNIELPRFGGSGLQKQNAGERQALLDAHSAACSLFEKLLAHPQQGEAARQYLQKRGFDAGSVQRFQIGLTLDSWDTLLTSPAMKKHPASLLQQAGLVKARENGGGFYDTFRNRLMFPIRDENARIIAFGGRIMPAPVDSQSPQGSPAAPPRGETRTEAKYLNSPETPLFSKSRCIFGLDLARQKIVETRTVAVVEGYTDVVMAHQYGATNVVSILGTALTEQHVGILRRFADRIVLLFDPDTAGDTAVARAVEMFLTQPVEVLIASMPEDLDPDEYLIKHGLAAFNEVVDSAQDALAFKWRQLTREVKDNDLTARQKAVRQYLELIANARGAGPIDPLRWHQSLLRISRLTGATVEELNRMFRQRRSRVAARLPTSDDVEPDAMPQVAAAPMDADGRALRWILGALLVEPGRWHDLQQHIHEEDFDGVDPIVRSVAQKYWAHQRDEGEPVFNEFLSLLDDEGKSLAIELAHEAEALGEAGRLLDDARRHLDGSRKLLEEKKTVAALRRIDDQAPEIKANSGSTEPAKRSDDDDEVDLLRRLAAQMARPDIRRT